MATTTTALAVACLLTCVTAVKHDVIMIAIDDMRPELGCYGCEYMKTPNMDALASAALVFDHMYTGIALCSPSRTLFLTTRRADTSRVWTISPKEYWRQSGGNFTSLPQHFKNNGYLTLATGKIFHPGAESNNSDSEYSWSKQCLPYQNTFPEPDGNSIYSSPAVHPQNCTDDETGEGKLVLNAVRLLKIISATRKGEQRQEEEQEQEDEQQQQRQQQQQPFFFATGFHRPHIPWHAPQQYYDMYDVDMPLAPNLEPPTDVANFALNNNWVGKYFNYTNNGTVNLIGQGYWTKMFKDLGAINITNDMPRDNSMVPMMEQKKVRQAYRAALSFTDRNIGVVLSEAKRLGLYENSIVVLWADHGYQLGDNGEWGKHTNFEHATRIPFMIRLPSSLFPNFKPGRTAAFVENVDLYPTLSDIAMQQPMARCSDDVDVSRKTMLCTEGLSFSPVFATPTMMWKSASFSQYNRDHETVMGYTIRTQGWRYTEWLPFNKTLAGEAGAIKWGNSYGAELYAHTVDTQPCNWDYENNNVATDPQHTQLVTKLRQQLISGWRAALPPSMY